MAFSRLDGSRGRPPVIETLFENTEVKIDRVIAQGQITPPGEFPDEPSHEFIYLEKGKLVLEYEGEAKKVTLTPGHSALKSPVQKTRADFTSEEEDTVWLKVSFRGERGRYPLFTGSVGADEIHPK